MGDIAKAISRVIGVSPATPHFPGRGPPDVQWAPTVRWANIGQGVGTPTGSSSGFEICLPLLVAYLMVVLGEGFDEGPPLRVLRHPHDCLGL